MRHGKKLNHLGRTNSHRKAMMANMACSLIMHKRINTTVAKAKALRTYVEPLITKSKNDTTHSRRTVFAYLKQKEAVAALFREVGVKVATRAGGYTRILKTGTRLGDNAEMCMIELVDFNEFIQDTPKAAPVKKATRRSRGAKKEEGAADTTASTDETPAAEKPKRAPRAKKKDDTKE
jgi:large subunit ribosomal protein L17